MDYKTEYKNWLEKVNDEELLAELRSMTEAQHAAEKARKETADKAWEEKWARRKKIFAIAKEHPGFVSDMQFDEEYFIETYHLSEEDLREIEEMVEKPVHCIDIRCLQQTA